MRFLSGARLRKTMLWALLIGLVLCFLQVGGYSTYSISFAAFALVVTFIGPKRYVAILPAVLLSTLLMMLGAIWYLHTDEVYSSLLRSARESAVFATILAATSRPLVRSERLARTAKYTVIGWLAISVTLALAQLLALRWFGNGPFLPWELYGATGRGDLIGTTVPSYWLEFAGAHGLYVGEGGVRVRPVAFYSEPSYFGFMLVAAYFCYARIEVERNKKAYCFLVCLAGALIAQTASGVLALGLAFLWNNRRGVVDGSAGYFFVAGLLALAAGFANIDRVINSFDASDLSGYARLVLPVQNVTAVAGAGRMFGVPSYFLPSFLGFDPLSSNTGAYGADNALANLFIFYGLGGAILVWLAYRHMRSDVFVMFLLACLFNGSVFSYDKGVVICLVTLVVLSRPVDRTLSPLGVVK